MYKTRLSFWQIWNMSFGFLGIQFGFGLQLANMSAIYAKLGAFVADKLPPDQRTTGFVMVVENDLNPQSVTPTPPERAS